MIEKPILFSGPMVRAILSGRKTQTRRVIKGLSRHWVQGVTPEQYRPGDFAFLDMSDPIGTYPTMFTAPYAPGDLLWVKETWGIFDASPTCDGPGEKTTSATDYAIAYRADDHNGKLGECYWFTRPAGEPELEANGKWRSPILMPRWASRISLNVLTVRCERLQDISEEDAKAEGVSPENAECNCPGGAYLNAFCDLWDSPTWDRNPWVYVYEFERR